MASFLFILPVAGKLDAFHLVIATRSVVPFFLYSGNVVFPYRRGTSGNILHHNTRNPNAHCTPQLHGLSCLTSIKWNQWILNQHSFCLVMRGKSHSQTSAQQSPRKIIPDELSRRLWGTIVDNRYTLGKSRMRPTVAFQKKTKKFYHLKILTTVLH